MTGPEHYLKAEEFLRHADSMPPSSPAEGGWFNPETQYFLAQAQVHATLALAAATALRKGTAYQVDANAWDRAASAHEERDR